MSGLANRPSTPGLAKAVSSRSSKLIRLPMASGRSPTPLAPRAGWSAAMIISRPSSPDRLRLVLASAARRMASGSCTRISVNARYRSRLVAPETTDVDETATPFASSDMFDLSNERLDLVGRRHRGGTLPAGGDDRTRRVAKPENGFQVPPGQQPVAHRATET